MDMSISVDSLDPAQAEELSFWNTELRLQGEYSDIVAIRLDPRRRRAEYPHSVFLQIVKHTAAQGPIKVVEIGSGPISTLAHGVDIGQIEVVAVDVLADRYSALMAKLGLTFPVVPVAGSAEALNHMFPRGSFDCAFARNSLDHTSDLPLAFDNLVKLVRPGGFIFLVHAVCEGANNKWSPSHKWSLDFGPAGLTAANKAGNIYYLERGKALVPRYLTYSAPGFGRHIEVLYQLPAI